MKSKKEKCIEHITICFTLLENLGLCEDLHCKNTQCFWFMDFDINWGCILTFKKRGIILMLFLRKWLKFHAEKGAHSSPTKPFKSFEPVLHQMALPFTYKAFLSWQSRKLLNCRWKENLAFKHKLHAIIKLHLQNRNCTHYCSLWQCRHSHSPHY